MTSMSIFDLDPTVTQESWEANWNKIKSEGVNSIESEGKTRDGSVFPIEVKAHFLEFEGEEFVCAFISDITDWIKQQEERKRLAIEKERFESELKIATLVQNDFLPEKPPERFDDNPCH